MIKQVIQPSLLLLNLVCTSQNTFIFGSLLSTPMNQLGFTLLPALALIAGNIIWFCFWYFWSVPLGLTPEHISNLDVKKVPSPTGSIKKDETCHAKNVDCYCNIIMPHMMITTYCV